MKEEIDIVLPKLGESIHSATVVQWFKKIGDPVQLDEPLLEVSTDKVNSEIPSPVAGILQEICAMPEQELQVGERLAVVLSGAVAPAAEKGIPSAASAAPVERAEERSDFLSPALLRLAQEKGVSVETLRGLNGTGEGGRVTKRDLELFLEKSKPCPAKERIQVPTVSGADVERLKMSGMRKAIAENMVRSFYEAPHATLVTEVDVTAILKVIQKEKETFLAKHGAKLTITSFIARALTRALKEFPLINASLDGDTILVKRYIHLGIAVSVDQGLLVPVIKNCQNLNLAEIAQAVGAISQKARLGKLSPEEMGEGTITITNFGMSGAQIGVPIIRYPEVAIVGIGAIHKKVVPLEDDVLAVRSMVYVSLTFDHRVLDGMYGCGFLGALQKHLEGDASL